MNKKRISALLFLVLPIFSLFAINASAEANYHASQTMDIGIITGVIALVASALVIYFIKKNRKY